MISLGEKVSARIFFSSGALGFDGKGYWWERLLIWLKLLTIPTEAVIILKTLTRHPTKGNLLWWCPWRCVRFIDHDGRDVTWKPWRWRGACTLNAVGLTNPGIDAWCDREFVPLAFSKHRVVVSIMPKSVEECIYMIEKLNRFNVFNLVGVEINASCPNSGEDISKNRELMVDLALCAMARSKRPVILNLGAENDCTGIAFDLASTNIIIRCVNTMRYNSVFPERRSPLKRLGGGGISGSLIRPYRDVTYREIRAAAPNLPIILGGGINSPGTLKAATALKPQAIALGTVMLTRPFAVPDLVRLAQCDPNLS